MEAEEVANVQDEEEDLKERVNKMQIFADPEEAMVRRIYLQRVLDSVPGSQRITTLAQQMTTNVQQRVIEEIFHDKKVVSGKKRELEQVMESHRQKMSKNQGGNTAVGLHMQIEEDLRKTRLKDALRAKDHLEYKLSHIRDSVEVLKKADYTRSPENTSGKKDMYSWINKEERNKSKANFNEKKQAASDMIKRVGKEKLERQKREQERQRLMFEKIQKEMELKNNEMKDREEEILKKRNDERSRMHDIFEERKKERGEQLQLLKKPQRKKQYMYMDMEKKYEKEVLMPDLEKRKAEIQGKRNLLRPINKEEILEHQRRVEEYLGKKDDEKKKELLRKRMEEDMYLHNQNRFKTAISEQIYKYDQKLREQEKAQKVERKALQEKMQTYAQIVKETCLPTVSEQKKLEREMNIQRLRHPVKRPNYADKRVNPTSQQEKVRGKKFYKVKSSQSASKSWIKDDDQTKTMSGGNNSESDERHAVKKRSPIKHKPKRQPRSQQEDRVNVKSRPPDYLAQLRKKREDSGGPDIQHRRIGMDWQSDMKNENLNVLQKYERIIDKASMIEERAKREERVLQAKGGADRDIAKGEFVSDLFIDAIKAKLAILDQL